MTMISKQKRHLHKDLQSVPKVNREFPAWIMLIMFPGGPAATADLLPTCTIHRVFQGSATESPPRSTYHTVADKRESRWADGLIRGLNISDGLSIGCVVRKGGLLYTHLG